MTRARWGLSVGIALALVSCDFDADLQNWKCANGYCGEDGGTSSDGGGTNPDGGSGTPDSGSVTPDGGATDAGSTDGGGPGTDGGIGAPDGGGGSDSGVAPNYMFVTSVAVVPGKLGGLTGADDVCNALAQDAGLSGNYVAFLSSSTTTIASRLGSASGWIRTDGRPFAQNLIAPLGPVRTPFYSWPTVSEHGVDEGDVIVVTETKSDGTLGTGSTCGNWTDAGGAAGPSFGFSGIADNGWTNFGSNSTCGASYHLYCFGVDRVAIVVPDAGLSRVAFLSQAFVPNTGTSVSAADNQCNAEAGDAGLPGAGTYLALLASNGLSAASRFNTDAGTPPWRSPDGVLLVSQASDLPLVDRNPTLMLSPLVIQADGGLVTGATVWTGSNDVSGAGAPNTDCQNWGTGNASFFGLAAAPATRGQFFDGGVTTSCGYTLNRVYCFQP